MPEGFDWIVIAALLALLFGGTQIPKLARSLGQAQAEFKKGLRDGDGSTESSSTDGSNSSDAA